MRKVSNKEVFEQFYKTLPKRPSVSSPMLNYAIHGCLDEEGNIILKALSNEERSSERSKNKCINILEGDADGGNVVQKFYNFRAGTATKITMSEAKRYLGKEMDKYIDEFKLLAGQALKVMPFIVDASDFYGVDVKGYSVSMSVAYRGWESHLEAEFLRLGVSLVNGYYFEDMVKYYIDKAGVSGVFFDSENSMFCMELEDDESLVKACNELSKLVKRLNTEKGMKEEIRLFGEH